MKFRKVVKCCLTIGLLTFSTWCLAPHQSSLAYAKTEAQTQQVGHCEAPGKGVLRLTLGHDPSVVAKPRDRAASLRAVASALGLDKGSVIADIGAGNGRDTWVFADIVGLSGKVYPEEIAEDKVKSLKEAAEKKRLAQVVPVLGQSDDPCLPSESIDLAYMNRVYHHFAKPRPMLRGIWRSLKPGGYLVIVDQRRGTLRDWVPRQVRENKHYWIAETTVVREAREEGFAFVGCAEHLWYEKEPFVLVFRRPKGLGRPGRDPDSFCPIPVEAWSRLFLPVAGRYRRPVLIALGQARELMVPILEHSSGQGLEIVLEEWATQKDERPPLPEHIDLPCVLTNNGDPHLSEEPIDVVFFLDSYHLLFHAKTLLAEIRQRLVPTGRVYVMDRRADEPLSRREASHRRMIPPDMVEQEMADAGFSLWFRGPALAPDRFLLVFGKEL